MRKSIIRQARLEDTRDIVEIHCGDVAEWTRPGPDGEKQVAAYEDLTIDERSDHGGPWMSIESCAIHLNNMLLSRNPVLVAETDGRAVGTAELFIGDEPPPFGRNAHLSILWVHKDHRGRGIGALLMDKCLSIAREHQCDTFSVLPGETAHRFYGRYGLEPFYEQEMLRLVVTERDRRCQAEDLWRPRCPPGRDLAMRIGRFQSSRQMWDQATWTPCAAWQGSEERSIRRISVDAGVVYVALSPDWGQADTALVFAWASPLLDIVTVTDAALAECLLQGFSGASVLVHAPEADAVSDKFGSERSPGPHLWARRMEDQQE